MQITKSKTFFIFRNPFFPSSESAALFHSTPTSLAKWKSKWGSDTEKGEPSSKDEDWYADDLSSKNPQQEHDSNDFCKNIQPKKSGGKVKSSSYDARASQSRKSKRKPKKLDFCDDYDEPMGTIFQSTFGSRSFTWTAKSWGDPEFENSTWSFQWKNDSKPKHTRKIFWGNSDTEEEPGVIGSSSDRRTLGLPSAGPLKMEDVKSAFRASALKWHPDKHQGPSQATAEEQFKLCVDAYKSLCNAISAS